ncbi:MAG: prepilin-type N-terminal cleavage/methylation domain-containing protein [Armatimonadota bacterium]
MKKNRGVTLIEVLISSAIFLMFLTAIYSCFVIGMRAYNDLAGSKDKTFLFRRACLALDLISSEIRQAESIYLPGNISLLEYPNSYAPVTGDPSAYTPPFIFKKWNNLDSRYEAIGYQLDKNSKQLERIIYYDETFTVADPAKQIKILTKSAGSLKFQLDSEDTRKKIIYINLVSCVDDRETVLETKVNMK